MSPNNFLKYFFEWRVNQFKNRKSTQDRLTKTPTFRILRREPKDGQYLDHNISNYVRHSRSWCDAGVNCKSLEEPFDAVEEVDKLVSAVPDVFGCLRVKVLLKWALQRNHEKHGPREEH